MTQPIFGGWAPGTTETRLREELDDNKVEVACVGPSGERLVRYAAIMNMRNRAAGRTGMGAVMGAKKLKAIAVRGSQRPAVADAGRRQGDCVVGGQGVQDQQRRELNWACWARPAWWPSQEFAGGLPTSNYRSGTFAHAEAISRRAHGRDDPGRSRYLLRLRRALQA